MKKYIITLSFILLCLTSFSKNLNDSIEYILNSTTPDTLKIKHLIDNAINLEFTNPDLAVQYIDNAMQLSKKINYLQGEGDSYVYLGLFSEDKAQYKNAIKYFTKAVKIFEKINDKKSKATALNNIGSMYDYIGLYDSALYYYEKSIIINKQINNIIGISDTKYNMGLIYNINSDYDKALNNWYDAIKIFEANNDYEGIASCQQMISIVLDKQGKRAKAIEYINKAKINAIKSKDYRLIAEVTMSLGNIFLKQDSIKFATQCFNEALGYMKLTGDEHGIAAVETNMADCYKYNNKIDSAIILFKSSYNRFRKLDIKEGQMHTLTELTECYKMKKDFEQSIKYSGEALSVANDLKSKYYQSQLYLLRFQIYQEIGDYKTALDNHIKYKSVNDSIFSTQKQGIIEELQTKYETEKKELALNLKQLELEQKTTEYNYILLALLIAIILIIVIFISYRQKRRINIILNQQKIEISEKNEELNQQNEEITTQRDEITAQRDEIMAQRDLVVTQKQQIELIHNEVSESIDYATRLQTAILPEEKILAKYVSEHFVLFKPKDKVSGDFYWWTNIENHTVITAADCTGHGVPGAFMSMMGISLLREIVEKEYITNTGLILKKLRIEIIKALKQTGKLGEQKDGMDMAIISIDHETNIMQFSGANNPLYIVKKGKLKVKSESSDAIKLYELDELSKFKLYEIKPDKMPISIYQRMNNFITHEIQLEKGDQIYMFSDGYADQFGGDKGRKFKYKPFKKLLINSCKSPMPEQKNILEKAFLDWKGDIEQIDDVVVMGIKI